MPASSAGCAPMIGSSSRDEVLLSSTQSFTATYHTSEGHQGRVVRRVSPGTGVGDAFVLPARLWPHRRRGLNGRPALAVPALEVARRFRWWCASASVHSTRMVLYILTSRQHAANSSPHHE